MLHVRDKTMNFFNRDENCMDSLWPIATDFIPSPLSHGQNMSQHSDFKFKVLLLNCFVSYDSFDHCGF